MPFQNINKSDDQDKTLLHLAAQQREVKLVKLYLKLGANIFLNSYDGETVFALVGNKEVGRDNILKSFDMVENEESIFKTFVFNNSVRMHEVQPKNSVDKGQTSAITLAPHRVEKSVISLMFNQARRRRPHWLNDLFDVAENSSETSIQDERKEVVLPSNAHPFNTS